MMSIEQHSGQCQVSERGTDPKNNQGGTAEDPRQGALLARAMIQHVCAMRAAGYKEEILVDGEVWGVEVKRKSPV